MELVRRREVQKATLLSKADKSTNLFVTGMFVRANDPSALIFVDLNNRKVKQLDLRSLQMQTVYSTPDDEWMVLNVTEVDERTLLYCEWNESILFHILFTQELYSSELSAFHYQNQINFTNK